MSNQIAEIADVFFNGRPAPKSSPIIRVKVTRQQLKGLLEEGIPLLFSVSNGSRILVVLKP